ncbi:hypothetical protein CEXT_363571 [Caerostris extrusa]|uniref:Uncharacterized protein n=1 Tax=Caerostris extrusa TaxID=172846 RepID=A0AAV4SVZ9_CAEEX|nr:hypothetical protein CEXT_363571 [Caerostris extrusa]
MDSEFMGSRKRRFRWQTLDLDGIPRALEDAHGKDGITSSCSFIKRETIKKKMRRNESNSVGLLLSSH